MILADFFNTFLWISSPYERLRKRAGFSYTELTRRIDPRRPEALEVAEIEFFMFQILDFILRAGPGGGGDGDDGNDDSDDGRIFQASQTPVHHAQGSNTRSLF